jgi:hypothetical protein
MGALVRVESKVRVLTGKEKDSDEVGKRAVHDLEDLFKDVMLVLGAHDTASDEVGQPQRVLRRELLDTESITEPLLPQVVMLVVSHTALALQTNR